MLPEVHLALMLSHSVGACDISGLDLIVQVPFCSHVREGWHLGMAEVQGQGLLLQE